MTEFKELSPDLRCLCQQGEHWLAHLETGPPSEISHPTLTPRPPYYYASYRANRSATCVWMCLQGEGLCGDPALTIHCLEAAPGASGASSKGSTDQPAAAYPPSARTRAHLGKDSMHCCPAPVSFLQYRPRSLKWPSSGQRQGQSLATLKCPG